MSVLDASRIRIFEESCSWQSSIRLAGQSLLDYKSIEKRYLDTIISQLQDILLLLSEPDFINDVETCGSAADWRDAIRIAVKPLEEHGYVEECYKEEIISNVEKMGKAIGIQNMMSVQEMEEKLKAAFEE